MPLVLKCCPSGGLPQRSAVEAAVKALAAGGLVVLPTDTVYGLAADPRVAAAAQRLADAKGRPYDKPIPFLAASIAQIRAAGARMDWSERALAERYWPGPLTLVLRVAEREEGFRIPAHPLALAVIEAAGCPLLATSANRSGCRDPITASAAMRSLRRMAALCLDAGPAPGGKASTVARVRNGRLEVIRAGVVPQDEMMNVLAHAARMRKNAVRS